MPQEDLNPVDIIFTIHAFRPAPYLTAAVTAAIMGGRVYFRDTGITLLVNLNRFILLPGSRPPGTDK